MSWYLPGDIALKAEEMNKSIGQLSDFTGLDKFSNLIESYVAYQERLDIK